MSLNRLQEKIKKTPFYDADLDKNIAFERLVSKENCNVDLDDDCIFIILSYTLSHYATRNDSQFPTGIDYKTFSKDIELSTNASRKILRKCQKILADLSIQCLKNIASHQGINNTFFDSLVKTGENGLPCFPCYLGMKILLSASAFEMLPLHIISNLSSAIGHVKSLELTYYVDAEKNTYVPSAQQTNLVYSSSKICIIGFAIPKGPIENVSEYLKLFNQYSITEILLFNMAAHPQFSGSILEKYQHNPYQDIATVDENQTTISSTLKMMEYELFERQKKAIILGFSRDNPRIFSLQHVFTISSKNSLHCKKKGLELPCCKKGDFHLNDLQIYND